MSETINSGNLSLKEKVDIIFKKNFGKVSSDVTEPFFAEPGLDARPRVFQSQIFQDTVPSTNPDDFGSALTTEATYSDSQNYNMRYYFRWQLLQLTNGNDSAFKGPSLTDSNGNVLIDNILENSIPFNYDTSGGYGVTLEYKDSSNVFHQISFGTGEWIIDPDGGILTFHDYSNVSSIVNGTSKRPYLTFYAYTGGIGIDTFAGYFTQDLTNNSGGFLHPTNENHTLVVGKTGLTDGSNALEVEGTSRFSGKIFAQEVICTSDARLKTDIERISNSCEKLLKLNGVSFRWKQTNNPSFGVLAQNLEEIFPTAVNTDANKSKSVNYNSLIALLIEAVKEVYQSYEQLKQDQSVLKQQYLTLESKYNELHDMLDEDADIL